MIDTVNISVSRSVALKSDTSTTGVPEAMASADPTKKRSSANLVKMPSDAGPKEEIVGTSNATGPDEKLRSRAGPAEMLLRRAILKLTKVPSSSV
jgi:hypothetical protein